MVPIFQIHLALEPVAKERPRVNRQRGTIYTPKKTADYERALANLLKEAGAVPNETDDLEIQCRFGVADQKRKDGDNMVKAVLDAGNKVLYRDDSQIIRGSWEIEYGVDQPYVALQLFSCGAAPDQNARSRPRKKAPTRPLPSGYDLCSSCQKRAKPIAWTSCRECRND